MHVIPEPGTTDDILERLNEYIAQFDTKWINKIKGADDQQISELISISEISRLGYTCPGDYLVYLETMGKNDGELLRYSFKADTDIDTILDVYYGKKDDPYHPIEPNHFVIGFEGECGVEYYMDLKDNVYCIKSEESNIPEMDYISSSFEKLMFQSAVKKYEKQNLPYVSYFGANRIDYETAMLEIKDGDMFYQVECLCRKFDLEKIWISDEWNFIAMNEDSSVWIKKRYGISGVVSSYRKDFTGLFMPYLKQLINVRIE